MTPHKIKHSWLRQRLKQKRGRREGVNVLTNDTAEKPLDNFDKFRNRRLMDLLRQTKPIGQWSAVSRITLSDIEKRKSMMNGPQVKGIPLPL
ncbi:hypothetical protein CDAR_35261 [Caerostris darwini]|uniref:Uncharacterized protein n=1 Tax=Caerostris darwini TaxID=1538125 RepID=A0AAV4SKR0_9ARAC|nr:hypothetical protein CDAR_35261 [Caerostris darwini]